MQKQTIQIMKKLRELARGVRKNNKVIDAFVDRYIDDCVENGREVVLLTQWCLSKGLERRVREHGQLFVTQGEIEIFQKKIPAVKKIFADHGVGVEWYITFNGGFTPSRRINLELKREYISFISQLAKELVDEGFLLLLDWEEDIMGGLSTPDLEVLESPQQFISSSALALELDWARKWYASEVGQVPTEEEIARDVLYQIACEVEEGKYISSPKFPLGYCLLVPLEVSEQYEFFSVKSPDFARRILPVLPPYPWRLNWKE